MFRQSWWKAWPISLSLFVFSCGSDEGGVYLEERAPERLRPEVNRAGEAMLALQTRLIEALTSELDRSGAVGAIAVCHDVAPAITADVSSGGGVTVGRTSHRLRNPDNAPPEWARPIVDESSGMKAEEAAARVFDLGDRVGVLRPIGTLGMCTTCHGDPAAMTAELRERLAESYPKDHATGFAVGDLRGWVWAEVTRSE